MPGLKRALVVVREATNQPDEVVGVLSARNSAHVVKRSVEWLYALMHYGPEDHLASAITLAPGDALRAQSIPDGTACQKPVSELARWGTHPELDHA